ncbi:MAG: ion transporter [Pseudomonadota bacterium]
MTTSRERVAAFVEHKKFTSFITWIILLNAVTLGMETSQNIYNAYGGWLLAVDKIILIIFTIELLLKFYAYRWDFFRSGWNWFDLIIVAISWLPAQGPLAILRALRILRVLRLLSVSPQLRRVIAAVGHSIPGMMSVISVLAIVFYISSVLATKLFGTHPSPEMQEWFGTIGASAYTLFQVMTLESWSMGIVRPVMEHFPWAWAFFVPFIFVTSFAVLNLFIGIIVDAMQSSHDDAEKEEAAAQKKEADAAIAALHARFDRLEQRLDALLVERAAQIPSEERRS